MKLKLCSSIIYKNSPEQTPDKMSVNNELIFCYQLSPEQSQSIEPDRGKFIGALVFVGEAAMEVVSATATHRENPLEPDQSLDVILPAGYYFFTQSRGERPLNNDEWLNMAIEQQKDGLWERNKLGDLLYIRYLHEDGMFATQAFRELKE